VWWKVYFIRSCLWMCKMIIYFLHFPMGWLRIMAYMLAWRWEKWKCWFVFAPFVLLAFYSKLSSLAGGCGTLLPFEWPLELVRLSLIKQDFQCKTWSSRIYIWSWIFPHENQQHSIFKSCNAIFVLNFLDECGLRCNCTVV
jgi:hypothetical protein